ncbi:type II toxin-antitoxin system Phd/YefM family antitoxin [Olsenella sp. YH-ols2217]|uniref:Type II toxin-antitoxin system Phd/YefM family antitoxin n=1 Tax=Kribbibacterium absianum TaxID=3044210 RepID=A0ABT6ZKV6_9ACTN|nr:MULTISPECIES: type II toxin-antitoxin system Phd/YefM family antitoxin [unclassified Olsenella]MDJ1122533.1 type II toxin-antitoxin system Phd/YefM family antitoxin [Olsenella sp. YH-ols2216]MDJ1129507.1 type II toxin-antitoxin system Phd/YefM family antitoxin [Olsenella sp. YH-ols2217]
MPTMAPVREMKDTAKFQELVEHSDGPVFVTNNGREAMVTMRPEDYDALLQEAAKARLLSRVLLAEDEYERGATVNGKALLARLKNRHG